jgi:hypothetical protein
MTYEEAEHNMLCLDWDSAIAELTYTHLVRSCATLDELADVIESIEDDVFDEEITLTSAQLADYCRKLEELFFAKSSIHRFPMKYGIRQQLAYLLTKPKV